MPELKIKDESPHCSKHVLPLVVGGLTITCEDNMELMSRYPDNHFDLAIVDPPYGMIKNTYGSGKVAPAKFRCDKVNHREWDIAPDKEYFNELQRISKNQIVWGANHFISKIPFDSSCWLIWDKDNTGDFADCEIAWTSFDKLAKIYKLPTPKDGKIHPTQKPIQLYKWLLHNYTSEGDLILDTHLGSGSIAIACHQMKRKLIGYEIDTEYYQKACKRFEEQTRQTALW